MTTARAGTALLCIALGAALFTAAEVASAKVVRWDLQNVTLPDGSAASGANATGFFLFDTDTGHTLDWDLAVEGSTPADPTRANVCGQPESGNGYKCFPAYRFIPSNSTHSGPFQEPERCTTGFPTCLIQVWYRADGEDFGDPLGRQNMNFILEIDASSLDFGGVKAAHAYQCWSYFGNCRYGSAGQVVAVPEPAEAFLLAVGLGMLLVGHSCRQKWSVT